MANLDNPIARQFYPLWKPVNPTDTTFQIQGRFEKESEVVGTRYLVGKQMFDFNTRGKRAEQEGFYMDVTADPTLIDPDNGVYEYTIASLDHRGVQDDNTVAPPTKYSSANRLRHETGTFVGIVNDPTYYAEMKTAFDSNVANRALQMFCFDATTDVSTGDGRAYFSIPEKYNGDSISRVFAQVITAGTTGTTDIQIHNVTNSVDILSTELTIDSTELNSSTAVVPAVIDTAHAAVTTNDLLRIDIDATSSTPAKGLIVVIEFLN